MRIIAIATALLLGATQASGEVAKSNVKVTRITGDDIAVSCRNGLSPQVKDLENGVVVVSCSR